MAYQNASTPRFYINIPEWLHSNGAIDIEPKLMTLPVLESQPIINTPAFEVF